MATPIHKGLKTHHQDQSMTWHSFKTMNANNRRDENPIPLLDFSFDIK